MTSGETDEEAELAYAAGLFEGEGTLVKMGSNRRGGARWMASISMVNLEPLQRFKDAVKLGLIYGPYGYRNDAKRKRKHHREYWRWHLHYKAGILELYPKLEKWLSAERKKKFEQAIKDLRLVQARKTDRRLGPKQTKTREV